MPSTSAAASSGVGARRQAPEFELMATTRTCPTVVTPATAITHRIVAADAHQVPRPFKTFAVRSEEPRHARVARAPYRQLHSLCTGFLDAAALHGLSTLGHSRMPLDGFSDIAYAPVTLAELAAAAPGVDDLVGQIAAALRRTGVLGQALAAYRHSVAARIDYLGCCGAGFHNDVSRHWTACLFWNLTLAVDDVEFVMPHAGVRLALAPGDLIVFDPTMAHGLCRPRDQGQALPASFDGSLVSRQVFLSGELPLTDRQWAGLGSPWLPVQQHHQRDALELMAAEFDEQTGAIKRPGSLSHCLLPTTPYADEAAVPPAQG